MSDNEVAIAELVLALKQLDDNGKSLTAEVASIAAQLAEVNKFLREAHVMLVRAAGIPSGVPLIGGGQ